MKKTICILFILFFFITSSNSLTFDYFDITIGMSKNDIISIIERNPDMEIDKSRFLGLINEAYPNILKISYNQMIENIYIQFYDDTAYHLTIEFNPDYFDYITLINNIEDRYGSSWKKSSYSAEWKSFSYSSNELNLLNQSTNTVFENPDIHDLRLRVESPSTVKFFDLTAMSRANQDVGERLHRLTNETTIESNKRKLLNEL